MGDWNRNIENDCSHQSNEAWEIEIEKKKTAQVVDDCIDEQEAKSKTRG